MGRGDSNLLGPLFPTKRGKVNKRVDSKTVEVGPAENILFAPLQKQDNDLYALDPSGAALKRAKEIIKDVRSGNPLPLLLALDKQKSYVPGKSPALDLIFEKIFAGQSDKVLRNYKLSKRDKAVKAEKKVLDREAAALLAQKTENILQENLSADQQIERMKKDLVVDGSLLTEVSLRSDAAGPIREVILGQIATTPLEDLEPEVLQSMLGRTASRQAQDVFQEIIRRQITTQLKRNLPYSATVDRDLKYGMLRASRKGPGLIHLLGNNFKTVCGKWGAKTYRLEYGDWTDGVRAGRYKRCPACEKNAPPDLALRVEAEHSDRAANILSFERQEEISRLARDPKVKAMIRAGLRQGKPLYEISEEVDHYFLRKTAIIVARAADEAVEEESRGKVIGHGRMHILWDSVNYSVDEKIRQGGYQGSSAMYQSRNKKNKRDELLHLTTAKEREQAIIYKMKANEASDYAKSKVWHQKSEDILSRGIKRVLRQERKGKDNTAEQLF